ncbi:MAG: hypothetical protein JWL73_2920 [Actinomycetia bacterium]|nr:hypothetical protein [Actinomycetes bacterium]
MILWLLRITWALLPLTGGQAAREALSNWSGPTRVVAFTLLWIVWLIGLVGVFTPRPLGATAVRTGAPIFVVLAIVSAFVQQVSAAAAAIAVIGTLVAFVLGATPAFGRASADGVAYGDERRFPLKVPPALFLGPLPLSVALLAAGISAGPLLLADGRWIWGAIATVVGWPLAVALLRSIHSLAKRWVVLVPAGIVVADAMTLSDSTLFPREYVASIAPVAAREPIGEAIDLRVGAVRDSLAIALTEPTDLIRVRRGRSQAEPVLATRLLVAPVAPRALRELARTRRLPAVSE